jgi:hypothetical protein
MLLFEWNALRVGERVAVHDDASPDLELREGTVRLIQTRAGSSNEVAIRLDAGSSTVLPRRHAVHLLPLDPRTTCWRCGAATAPTREVAA